LDGDINGAGTYETVSEGIVEMEGIRGAANFTVVFQRAATGGNRHGFVELSTEL
jgi:hypothetical protein